MRSKVISLLKHLPYLRDVASELAELRHYRTWVPPGHFHSPIPSPRSIDPQVLEARPRQLPAVDLNETGQLALLSEFAEYYREIPWSERPTPGLRYYFDNDSYGHSDAICLYAMIRHARPARIIEVGSGYSSCVFLDTNERFFGNRITCTFIDPHPERLLSLISEADRGCLRLIDSDLQRVSLDTFEALTEGDILFIDSTHVVKTGGEVNYIFFDILPRLRAGVFIHFHDVHYPFEYPASWVYEGRAWNEAYFLRAFLQYNNEFEVVFFNTYLEYFHEEFFRDKMPLCLKEPGGSIWIKKARGNGSPRHHAGP
jgi:predicted O-methyltransferase YrrM